MEEGGAREVNEDADIVDPNVPDVTPTEEDLEASAAIDEAMKALWAHADETGEIFVGVNEQAEETEEQGQLKD